MLQRIISAICFSNTWIAFAAVLNFVAYSNNMGFGYLHSEALMVFTSTFFLYNAQRLWFLPSKKLKNKRLLWVLKHQKILKGLSVFALLICLAMVFTLSLYQLLIGVLLFVISVAYSYFPMHKPLRFYGILKTILVAVVWVLVVVFFNETVQAESVFTLQVLRFLVLVYLLTLMFEYRDLKTDQPNTLPKKLSKNNFAYLMYSLVFTCVVISYLDEQYCLAIADIVLLNYLVYNNFRTRKELFYSFQVDGYLVINALILLSEIGI